MRTFPKQSLINSEYFDVFVLKEDFINKIIVVRAKTAENSIKNPPKISPLVATTYGKAKIPEPNAVDINVKIDPLNDPGCKGENVLATQEC